MNRRDLAATLRASAADLECLRDHGPDEAEGWTFEQIIATVLDVADEIHGEDTE